MYKVLLLRKDSVTEPLWTPYKIVTESNEKEEFETEDMIVLENIIKDLLVTTPKNHIKPINDLDFMLEVVMGDEI